MEPRSSDVRAGLGTSLLIRGIFNSDDDDGRHWLSLAAYHLKIASSLCSSAAEQRHSIYDNSATVVEGGGAASSSNVDTISPISYRSTSSSSGSTTNDDINSNAASTHAAILHNLALANLALGEDVASAVPILLRAAALGRRAHDYPSIMRTKPYWNAPHDVLYAVEERALLIAAKNERRSEEEEAMNRRRRVPFLPRLFVDGLDADETMMGM